LKSGKWKIRWFALQKNLLVWCRQRVNRFQYGIHTVHQRQDQLPTKYIPIDNALIQDASSEKPFCFSITPQNATHSIFLQASSQEEMQTWMDALLCSVRQDECAPTPVSSPSPPSFPPISQAKVTDLQGLANKEDPTDIYRGLTNIGSTDGTVFSANTLHSKVLGKCTSIQPTLFSEAAAID
jgi:hypothetical protein